jgi:hypothetical protein
MSGLRGWWQSNPVQYGYHLGRAYFWAVIGWVGAAQYVVVEGWKIPSIWAEWVAAVFFMSAVALYESDKAIARTYKLEENQT